MTINPASRETRRPDSRSARTALILILAAFALLGVTYSVSVPIFEASDELWHYPMIEHISRTGRLPVQPLEPGTSSGPWRQQGSQPPLYYALGAVLTAWIDTSDMTTVRQPNPHAKAGEITPERNNVNLVIPTPHLKRFPWSGTVLAVHVVRLFSVALAAWSIYLTWALVRELFPVPPWLAVTAAGVQAFTPMHIFISSSINNDNLIIPLSTLTLLLMARRVKQAGRERSPSLHATVALGSVLGLALLTKASGLALVPLALATLAWEIWRRPNTEPWRRRVVAGAQQLLALLLPALLIAGWWFYRNARLYGDWLGLNAFYAVLGTRDVPATLGQLWAERFAFAAGFWGNFGGLNVPMPNWTYAILNTAAVIALAGLTLRFSLWLVGRRPQVSGEAEPEAADPPTEQSSPMTRQVWAKLWPFAWSNSTAARALAWAWAAAVLVSWTRWSAITWSSQGRLIFSAFPIWSAALILGLGTWMPRFRSHTGVGSRASTLPGMVLAVFLLSLSVVALPSWILPAYRPPAALETAPPAPTFEPLDAQFGAALELVGYRLATVKTHPGAELQFTLLWRALGAAQSHHSVFIHVLGAGDRIVTQRDTFPGHGLLPATQLEVGRLWVEQHVLPIPITAYAPDDLTLAVGLYDTSTGVRLGLVDQPQAISSDTIRFGQLSLVRRAGQTEANVIHAQFGDGMQLESYDLDTLIRQPGEQVTVTLIWRCTAPIPNDYTISVQLIDDQWRKAAQSDAWPLDGQAPTSSWEIGERIVETRTLTVDPEAEPSPYRLRVAVYRPTEDGTLDHLPVSLRREDMPTQALILTTLRVR